MPWFGSWAFPRGPGLQSLGGGGAFKRRSLVRGHWDCAFQGTPGTLSSFSCPVVQVSEFVLPCALPGCAVSSDSKAAKVSNPEQKSVTWELRKPSSLKHSYWDNCYRSRRLTAGPLSSSFLFQLLHLRKSQSKKPLTNTSSQEEKEWWTGNARSSVSCAPVPLSYSRKNTAVTTVLSHRFLSLTCGISLSKWPRFHARPLPLICCST